MEIMLEGGGRMKQGSADYSSAIKLGRLLKHAGHTAIVSACGGLANAMLTSRLTCDGYTYHQDIREPLRGFRNVIDIRQLAEDMGQHDLEVVWGLYVGLMLKAKAFIFFPGREETKAQLMAAIALNTKIWGKLLPEGNFRRIALIGWKDHDILALYTFFPKASKWMESFGLEQVEEIARFITSSN